MALGNTRGRVSRKRDLLTQLGMQRLKHRSETAWAEEYFKIRDMRLSELEAYVKAELKKVSEKGMKSKIGGE